MHSHVYWNYWASNWGNYRLIRKERTIILINIKTYKPVTFHKKVMGLLQLFKEGRQSHFLLRFWCSLSHLLLLWVIFSQTLLWCHLEKVEQKKLHCIQFRPLIQPNGVGTLDLGRILYPLQLCGSRRKMCIWLSINWICRIFFPPFVFIFLF